MPTFEEIREAAAKQLVVQDLDDRKLLALGDRLWPFPFPLVKGETPSGPSIRSTGWRRSSTGAWARTNSKPSSTVREYVDAQREYASSGSRRRWRAGVRPETDQHRRGDRWPLLAGGSGRRRKPGRRSCRRGRPGKGQAGRAGISDIGSASSTAQGDDVAGGDYDYVINGNMIGGFALLAWPVEYEVTGVTYVRRQPTRHRLSDRSRSFDGSDRQVHRKLQSR